jgi:hypothetical protein
MLDDGTNPKVEGHAIMDGTAKQATDFILNLDRRQTLGRSHPRKGEPTLGAGFRREQQGEERHQSGPSVLCSAHAHRRTIDRTICEEPDRSRGLAVAFGFT